MTAPDDMRLKAAELVRLLEAIAPAAPNPLRVLAMSALGMAQALQARITTLETPP